MGKNKLSSISKADTLEKMGEFWDTHDFTDFDDPNAPDVEFEVSCAVSDFSHREKRVICSVMDYLTRLNKNEYFKKAL